MSYRLEPGEPPGEGARRIAREQAGKALADLRCDERSVSWRIHALRKRLKKLRGLLRLVRPAFADYKAENRRFRDLAREVSAERDARMLLDWIEDTDGLGSADPLRRWFALRSELADEIAQDKLPGLERSVAAATADIETWCLDDVDRDALQGGVKKTWKRARKRFRRAQADPGVRNFHAFRKRAKYHWYHLRLTEPLLAPGAASRVEAFDRLSDRLGDAHDQSVLIDAVDRLPGFLESHPSARLIVAAALERRSRYRREACELAATLLDAPADYPVIPAGRAD